MLDPGLRATGRTPQPSKAVPKRSPEAPGLPRGYPHVIRRLSAFDRYGSSCSVSPMELTLRALPRDQLCCTDTASKRVKYNTGA